MKTYTVKEASEILGISNRAVQKRCKKDNVRRRNNRYSISQSNIDEWLNERTESKKNELSERTNELKNELERLTLANDKLTSEHERLNNELERLNNVNQELKSKLETYDIEDNERIEVFTHQEYEIFEQRLREWFSLQKDLQHKEQVFDAEKKSLSELLDHYKNQFQYQKKQSERILDMHQQLIDNIQKQNVIQLQRQAIEAKEKNVK